LATPEATTPITHDDQWSSTETKLISTQQCSHNHIESCAELSISLNDHTAEGSSKQNPDPDRL